MSPRYSPQRNYSKPLIFYFPTKYNNPLYSASWSQKWMKILPPEIKSRSTKIKKQNFSYYEYSNVRCDAVPGCLTIHDQKYLLTISSEVIPDSTWDEIAANLSKKALWEVLLKGDFPNFTQIPSFAKIVDSLVPQSFPSLRIKCSCQDEKKINQNVCVHVRQAWPIVASQIQDNPWLLFQFRGRTRKQIYEMIHLHRARRILQQHQDLKDQDPAPPYSQLLPVEGDWGAAFWQSELPLQNPFPSQNQTGTIAERFNLGWGI